MLRTLSNVFGRDAETAADRHELDSIFHRLKAINEKHATLQNLVLSTSHKTTSGVVGEMGTEAKQLEKLVESTKQETQKVLNARETLRREKDAIDREHGSLRQSFEPKARPEIAERVKLLDAKLAEVHALEPVLKECIRIKSLADAHSVCRPKLDSTSRIVKEMRSNIDQCVRETAQLASDSADPTLDELNTCKNNTLVVESNIAQARAEIEKLTQKLHVNTVEGVAATGKTAKINALREELHHLYSWAIPLMRPLFILSRYTDDVLGSVPDRNMFVAETMEPFLFSIYESKELAAYAQ